jgi:ketosteroid isomerase-like protein
VRSIVALLLASAALASCVPESGPSAVEVVSARIAVDSLWNRFAEAGDRHDAEAFGAILAEDAGVVYTGSPTVHGRGAAQVFLAGRRSGDDVTALRVAPDDFKAVGILATQSGSFEEDYTREGAARTDVGRFLLVAQRGSDGVWRIWRLFAAVDTTLG